MKSQIGVELVRRTKNMLHSVAIVSTALDPRFKNMDFLHGKYLFKYVMNIYIIILTGGSREKVFSDIEALAEQHYVQEEVIEEGDVVPSVKKLRYDETLKELFGDSYSIRVNEPLQNQIFAYKRSPCIDIKGKLINILSD